MRGLARLHAVLKAVFNAIPSGPFGRWGVPREFDEHAYLAANEDVARAVEKGHLTSGARHWRENGRFENRPLRPIPATRFANDGDVVSGAHPRADAGEVRAGSVPNELTPVSDPQATRPPADPSNRFDAPAYAQANPDVANALGVERDALYRHWRVNGVIEGRTPYGLAPYGNRTFGPGIWKKRDGITFFGLLDAMSGLGASARAYLDAMRVAGFDVEAVTVRDAQGRFEVVPPSVETEPGRAESQKRRADGRINVFHLNADMTHRFFIDRHEGLLDDSYNIGIWFWELAHFRQDWASAFGAYDELWVSTEFARAAISAVSPVPVIKIPMPVPRLPVEAPLPRSYFQLPDAAFLFGCIFDVGSLVERKNPAAAISAFLDGFAGRDDVMLVMKYHGAHHYPTALNAIKAMAAGHANIRFMEQVFTQHENHAFKVLLDCIVSPHRSEGFGLNLAEGMMLGTSVIATGYSGNTEFMSSENSYLIDYMLQEIDRQAGPYPRGALWAEPDLRHLARLMRDVVDDSNTARARAARARADILGAHDTRIVADAIERRIDALGLIGRPPPPFLTTWGAGVHQATRFIAGDGPVISVIVPIRDVAPARLSRRIESFLGQSHAYWELVLYDDGSQREDTVETLRRFRGSDSRIKVAFGGASRGTTDATNAAIELSSGEFLAVLDFQAFPDDALSPDALAQVVTAIEANSAANVVCFDAAKPASNAPLDEAVTPDGSPEPLGSATYPHRLIVIRRSLVLEAGSVHAALDAAQDRERTTDAAHDAPIVVHLTDGPDYAGAVEASPRD